MWYKIFKFLDKVFKLHSNNKMVSKVFYKVLNMHNNNKLLSKVVSKVPNMHNINKVVKVIFLSLGLSNCPYLLRLTLLL